MTKVTITTATYTIKFTYDLPIVHRNRTRMELKIVNLLLVLYLRIKHNTIEEKRLCLATIIQLITPKLKPSNGSHINSKDLLSLKK